VKFLPRWNRWALWAWWVAPPTAFLTYLAFWSTLRHGSGRNDATPYRAGLVVLVLCGLAGLLAACGVGGQGGERPRGRVLGLVLAPLGVWAGWALVLDLRAYGFSG
jgi:hypothetical protein